MNHPFKVGDRVVWEEQPPEGLPGILPELRAQMGAGPFEVSAAWALTSAVESALHMSLAEMEPARRSRMLFGANYMVRVVGRPEMFDAGWFRKA